MKSNIPKGVYHMVRKKKQEKEPMELEDVLRVLSYVGFECYNPFAIEEGDEVRLSYKGNMNTFSLRCLNGYYCLSRYDSFSSVSRFWFNELTYTEKTNTLRFYEDDRTAFTMEGY